MAKMKYNYFEFWWFAYEPYMQYSYRGETVLLGDISTKASGYVNTMYEDRVPHSRRCRNRKNGTTGGLVSRDAAGGNA